MSPAEMSPAEELKQRLRADLRAAMTARRSEDVATLRSLIAEIDNAEAVPVGHSHDAYLPRAFGEPGVEAPRRALTDADLAAVLQRDIDARLAAADDFERHGQGPRAEALRAQAALTSAYLPQA